MFWLPWDIGQKFAVAQVSRYWREVALGSHLFWSSFSSSDSRSDCNRVPIVLQYSGVTTMLHVEFRFAKGGHDGSWPVIALDALVPYIARIQSLDAEFPVERSPHGLLVDTVLALFNESNLEFPVLKTLRLKGPIHGATLCILLKAPQLRTLDLECFNPEDLKTLLPPSLENIRLYKPLRASTEILCHVFTRCPRVWRVVSPLKDGHLAYLASLAGSQQFAPALRELELGIDDEDIGRLISTAFPHVVLPTLTGSFYDPNLEALTHAIMPGVGHLVVFEMFDVQCVEVRDEDGRIRRFQCVNEEDTFRIDDVWRHLSLHYNLDKTVREIRIGHWNYLVDIFEFYPPQLQEGITLVLDADSNFIANLPTESDWSNCRSRISKNMSIPGLVKVEFYGPRAYLRFSIIAYVLAHIEPPTGRKVEICIGSRRLVTGDSEQDNFGALQAVLAEKCWVICSECTRHCVH
ncbi:hypothetical protein K438DRAFT_1818494 [Mycena galopus ATCC 62051]|nr:hypothetical protein K438DRAFT_1818494 [Mycena galopus ATCC 62051]